MKHKRITALLLGMVLALSGCTDARDAYGEETVASTASTESSSSQEASKETSEPSTEVQNSTETASSEPDGMVSAGSREDMGLDNTWMKLYAGFIEEEFAEALDAEGPDSVNGWSFGLIYVNDDATPELVISSGYEAAGNIICTVVNDSLDFMNTSRLCFYYSPFMNVLVNSDGNMGYYYDDVYQITEDGCFKQLHHGENADLYDDNGYTGEREYAWDDTKVTKDQYQRLLDNLINPSLRVYWGQGCSYDEMMNYLHGTGPKSYMEAYKQVLENLSLKAALSGRVPEEYRFALIDQENGDPMLLCVCENDFFFCGFTDGLLQVGPKWWYSDSEFVLVYPRIGVVQNNTMMGENGEAYITNYWMTHGSGVYSYVSKEVQRDKDWLPVLDANGEPVFVYKTNGSEVSKEKYQMNAETYDEEFKQQLVPWNAETTYIDYYTMQEMLKMLKGR